MYLTLLIKRPFIWILRFRHRCGYGVHSPFAFSLITDVIYEKRAYYAYRSLQAECRKMERKSGWRKSSDRVNRFLFRLVNRIQPETIVDLGEPSAVGLYLQAAKPSAIYRKASGLSEFLSYPESSIDLLFLHDYKNPSFVKRAFDICADRTTSHTVFVVEGICYSGTMRTLWKHLQEDDRVGITFDLYDVGLLFFDKTKIKQHYIVNF